MEVNPDLAKAFDEAVGRRVKHNKEQDNLSQENNTPKKPADTSEINVDARDEVVAQPIDDRGTDELKSEQASGAHAGVRIDSASLLALLQSGFGKSETQNTPPQQPQPIQSPHVAIPRAVEGRTPNYEGSTPLANRPPNIDVAGSFTKEPKKKSKLGRSVLLTLLVAGLAGATFAVTSQNAGKNEGASALSNLPNIDPIATPSQNYLDSTPSASPTVLGTTSEGAKTTEAELTKRQEAIAGAMGSIATGLDKLLDCTKPSGLKYDLKFKATIGIQLPSTAKSTSGDLVDVAPYIVSTAGSSDKRYPVIGTGDSSVNFNPVVCSTTPDKVVTYENGKLTVHTDLISIYPYIDASGKLSSDPIDKLPSFNNINPEIVSGASKDLKDPSFTRGLLQEVMALIMDDQLGNDTDDSTTKKDIERYLTTEIAKLIATTETTVTVDDVLAMIEVDGKLDLLSGSTYGVVKSAHLIHQELGDASSLTEEQIRSILWTTRGVKTLINVKGESAIVQQTLKDMNGSIDPNLVKQVLSIYFDKYDPKYPDPYVRGMGYVANMGIVKNN